MIEWDTILNFFTKNILLSTHFLDMLFRSPGPFTRIGRFRDGSGVGPGFGEMSPWPLAMGATNPVAKVNRFSSSVFTVYSAAETTAVFYLVP